MTAKDDGGLAYPGWLRTTEEGLVWERRRADLNGASPAKVEVGTPPARVGLALSGGGIRSATFSLGVLQALAKANLLERIDFLSTVSGGGYVGSFLGALYARGVNAAGVKQVLTDFPESQALRWLRDNGRFLAPNGSGANWLAGGILLRNWVSLLVVLAPAAFCIAFASIGLTLGVDALVVAVGHWSNHELSFDYELGGVPVSSLWLVTLVAFAFWMLPTGTAYWMVRSSHRDAVRGVRSVLTPLALLLIAAGALWLCGAGRVAVGVAAAWLVVTFAVFALGAGQHWRDGDHDNIARNRLSEWLKGGLLVVAGSSLVALCDSLGHFTYDWVTSNTEESTLWASLASLASGAGGVILASHRLLAKAGGASAGGFRVPLQALALLVAWALLLVGGVGVSALSLAAIDAFASASVLTGNRVPIWIQNAPFYLDRLHDWMPVLVLGGVSFLLMYLLGQFVVFVNQSSLSAIYSARIKRAYVGASNGNRWDTKRDLKGRQSPTEPIEGDDLAWKDYRPHLHGGPLHLINVTVNETIDPRVQLHQPDRRGMTMAVGPVGVSLAVRHHAPWKKGELPPEAAAQLGQPPLSFRVFPGDTDLSDAEVLPVGQWVGISGAAIAPGLGSRTLWGFSLLLGVFNMRLGYWWDSGMGANRKHQAKAVGLSSKLAHLFELVLPVYRFLFAEVLARFPGTANRRWYLTDGGHSENTGCYELIRRRVPFIICCDNGADSERQLGDLANLVRMARVDFGANVEFLTADELARVLDADVSVHFGELGQLRASGGRPVYAALAHIRYEQESEDEQGSWLMVIKPTLGGEAPADVTHYAAEHPDFPQQSTGDQSFDDAQWEAYRKLGHHIGERLFRASDRARVGWRPSRLDMDGLLRLKIRGGPKGRAEPPVVHANGHAHAGDGSPPL